MESRYEKRQCSSCKGWFLADRNPRPGRKRTRCDKCKGLNRPPYVRKRRKCMWCGGKLEGQGERGRNRKFCSPGCRSKHRWRRTRNARTVPPRLERKAEPMETETESKRLSKVRVKRVRLRDLEPRPVNARYMTDSQMLRLTENVRRDGRLTSTILVHAPEGSGRMEILSGHHRVEAALAAGLEEADAHVISDELTEDRKTAIQLSHNAIAGQDDPDRLAELYDGLETLDEREYSGLTDADFEDLRPPDIDAHAPEPKPHKEIVLHFPEGEEGAFLDLLERIETEAASKAPRLHLAARSEDFDRTFEAAARARRRAKAMNVSAAVRLLADLAMERLDQMEGGGPKSFP